MSQHISYKKKKSPDEIVRITYDWALDIKLIAAVHFTLKEWWMDAWMSMMIDALQNELNIPHILDTFDKHCEIIIDPVSMLAKDNITVSELFSNLS